MKIIDMTCPKCGATMKADFNKEQASCEYCGYQVLLEKEETSEEIRRKAQSKSYGYHKGKMEAEAEMQKKKKAAKIRNTVIVLAVILVAVLLMNGVGELSKPKINPFEAITVTFQGIDGKGEVLVEMPEASAEVNYSQIDYEISKENKLYQGEQITITATSDEYRLTETTQNYIVEGLDEYLKDPAELSQEALELIHIQAGACLEYDFDIFMYQEPVKIYLLTDGKQTNKLYDVYAVHFMTKEGEKVYYVPVCFSGGVLREGGQITLGSASTYMGSLIQVESWQCITGFHSLEEVRADILTSEESNLELKEMDIITEE